MIRRKEERETVHSIRVCNHMFHYNSKPRCISASDVTKTREKKLVRLNSPESYSLPYRWAINLISQPSSALLLSFLRVTMLWCCVIMLFHAFNASLTYFSLLFVETKMNVRTEKKIIYNSNNK